MILLGPPSEPKGMWPEAIQSAPVASVLARAPTVHQDTIRAYGLSEADLAAPLRTAEQFIDEFGDL